MSLRGRFSKPIETRLIGDKSQVTVGAEVLALYDGIYYPATVNRLPPNKGI